MQRKMKIEAKLFDLNSVNRGYKYNHDVINELKRYVKDTNGTVYSVSDETMLDFHHPNLEDVVGKVESVKVVDSCAWGQIELFDTPKGKIWQDIINEIPNGARFEPIWTYRKLGDKILDLNLEYITVMANIAENFKEDDNTENSTSDDSGSRD